MFLYFCEFAGMFIILRNNEDIQSVSCMIGRYTDAGYAPVFKILKDEFYSYAEKAFELCKTPVTLWDSEVLGKGVIWGDDVSNKPFQFKFYH